MNKLIFSWFKLFMVAFALQRHEYIWLKDLNQGKHFYNWQWRVLDKCFGVK